MSNNFTSNSNYLLSSLRLLLVSPGKESRGQRGLWGAMDVLWRAGDAAPRCPQGRDEAAFPSEDGNKVTFTVLIM